MISRIYNCLDIHEGGGIVYLSLMHEELDRKDNLLLLDFRAKGKLEVFKYAEIKYYKKTIFRNFLVFLKRYKVFYRYKSYLYKVNKNKKFKEYFLSGIPPLFRFSNFQSRNYILFQNRNIFNNAYLLNIFKLFKFKYILYHLINKSLINILLRKRDIIIVQTKSMQKLISIKKPFNKIILKDNYFKNININDYFKNYLYPINCENKIISDLKLFTKNSTLFFYPALYLPHKNHNILFSSFNKASKVIKKNIKLIVTIKQTDFPKKFNTNNIISINNLPLHQIHEIYKFVDYLIYPSISESLGLPLLEAKLNKLPIIASDMDFVYDICIPISTFNPFSEDSVFEEIYNVLK